eukprot:gene7839-7906_t
MPVDVVFGPAKDATNRAKHGVPLAFGAQVFADRDHIVFAAIRPVDGEDRFKAVGMIDGKLWPVVHVYRGDAIRLISKEPIIAIPADADDPDDFAVSEEGVNRAVMGRRIRRLRLALGLSQAEFAQRFGIPVANIRQYEIGRTMPPAAVQAYLKVIEADPERVAAAIAA